MNKKLVVFLIFVLFFSIQLKSQNSSELLLSIKKLNTVGSVLYIAAHPDDENTRLLPYLSKEQNLRTGYLSLTRGDGGQNLIGKEQGEELGIIRTQELMAARRVDGAEQYFTRANDFGFSKNPEETFGFWNKDSILSDVVWVIRNFKPDVIICRFPTTGEGGHGHHTASAILAVEAFEAAADPSRFPRQLALVETWQAKRLFWNTFNFGGNNTTAPDQLKLDVGAYNSILGKGYGELASESRSMHKSQGFGTAKARGTNLEYFKLLKGSESKSDLFEGVDISWNRFGVKQKISKQIEVCVSTYNAQDPSKSIPALVKLYELIKAFPSTDDLTRLWKTKKLKELEIILVGVSGLWIETVSADYSLVPGGELQLTTQIIARTTTPVQVAKISYVGIGDTLLAFVPKLNELNSFSKKGRLSLDIPYSNQYWLNEPYDYGLYTVKNLNQIGRAENEAPLKVKIELSIGGLVFSVDREVVYKFVDPVKGEVYRPVEVVPPVTINISESIFVFTNKKPKKIQFVVKANQHNIESELEINVPKGWSVEIEDATVDLKSKGDEVVINALMVPSDTALEVGNIEASIIISGKKYNLSIVRIQYDHIPYQFKLQEASASLVKFKLKKDKERMNIGYIEGSGDDVAVSLKQIGYNVTQLTEELILKGDLTVYDAIITGVRAYNTNERLQVYYPTLMNYIEKGGNLIVQYNTNNRLGPVLAKIGPYPFTISRNRVTDENAKVVVLDTAHSVVNYPNKITDRDFEGWVQERGIYFATELDSAYTTIFSMNDPNEKPSDGSLIIAKYGKGNFIYTGLSFFRELPAGVPGAYKLFVNLLSLPKNEE